MRLVIQSANTGKFLCPSLDDGAPVWVVGLREAGGGVVSDVEALLEWVAEYCEVDDVPVLVDLDRLGTANDYPVVSEK